MLYASLIAIYRISCPFNNIKNIPKTLKHYVKATICDLGVAVIRKSERYGPTMSDMELQLRSDTPALYPYDVQLIHCEHTKRYIRP